MDFLVSGYLWIKALHIISVICWMAALFYLPRLFVYHAEKASVGSELSETLKIMERRLLKAIMTPSMLSTWFFGVLLMMIPGGIEGGIWFYVKLILVLGMTGFHGVCSKTCKVFAADENQKSGRYYRWMNEVPTILMILIVLLVVIKPF